MVQMLTMPVKNLIEFVRNFLLELAVADVKTRKKNEFPTIRLSDVAMFISIYIYKKSVLNS